MRADTILPITLTVACRALTLAVSLLLAAATAVGFVAPAQAYGVTAGTASRRLAARSRWRCTRRITARRSPAACGTRGPPRRQRHQRSGGAVDLPIVGAVNPLSDAVQRINPTRSVAGYHPVPAVKSGQIVCKDGARTSRPCGPVPKVNPDTGGFATHLRPPDAGPGSPASASTFMRTS